MPALPSEHRLLFWRISLLVTLFGIVGVLFVYSSDGFGYTKDIAMLDPMAAVITSPGTNISLVARPAAFGPSIPVKQGDEGNEFGGFTGSLAVVESLGCQEDKASEDLREKIALVSRGGCGFYEKVLVLQKWGAVAVIVGDNAYHRGLVTMFNRDDNDDAMIPSVFVSRDSYEFLRGVEIVTITNIPESGAFLDTVLFLLVSPLFSLSMIYAILVVHRRYRIMKERLPKSYVEHIPKRVWVQPESQDDGPSHEPPAEGSASPPKGPEKVWVSSGECIICLEDYVPGISEVMRLPCGHEFHAACITRWLVCRKKTCPICKKDVTEATEHTPLIDRIMRRGPRQPAQEPLLANGGSEPAAALEPAESVVGV